MGEPGEAVVVEAYDNSGAGLLVNPAAWASSLSQNLARCGDNESNLHRKVSDVFELVQTFVRHLDSSEAVRAFVAEGSHFPELVNNLRSHGHLLTWCVSCIPGAK